MDESSKEEQAVTNSYFDCLTFPPTYTSVHIYSAPNISGALLFWLASRRFGLYHDVLACIMTFWLEPWHFDSRFDVLACTLTFWSHFDLLARALMFWLTFWSFDLCFDVLACTFMFWLALWHFTAHACFGLRFNVLTCAVTFWIALWCFGLRYDIWALTLMFRLALWRLGLCLHVLAHAEKNPTFPSKPFTICFESDSSLLC